MSGLVISSAARSRISRRSNCGQKSKSSGKRQLSVSRVLDLLAPKMLCKGLIITHDCSQRLDYSLFGSVQRRQMVGRPRGLQDEPARMLHR